MLTVRNEGAFLLEWLAHHLATGFTDFLVFSNDCQDGTDVMLDRLQAMGHLTHVRNDGPYDQRGIQFTALKHADRLAVVRDADWILTLDIDEFVNIHAGDGTLTDLRAALPDATAITLTWRLFGHADGVHFSDAPVTETVTRCAPVVMSWPWRAAMFKTLYRNDGTYRKLGVHRPRSPDRDRLPQARWYDGEGRALDDRYLTGKLFSDYGRSNYRLVQLNHYPLGAMESYVLKADRGRVNRSDLPLGLDYWVERNFNIDTDDSIARMAPHSNAIRADLMADPDLSALHQAAVDWRHARFRALMLEEPGRALFGRLLMTPPSRLLPEAAAQTLIGFALQAQTRNKDTGDSST